MSLEGRLLDWRRLDLLADGTTALHRADARGKVIVTAVFLLCVVSFDRDAVAPLLPYFALLIVLAALAGLPAAFIARKAALVLPFALAVGFANPWFERDVVVRCAGYEISAGWVSLVSIALRAWLAAAAAIVLIAVTGFPALCEALARMRVPRPFVVQLMLLHRYLSVLGEEASRMAAARRQRAAGRPLRLADFGPLAGRLLLRSFDRAERIHMAMRARGFDGEFRRPAAGRIGAGEATIIVGCCVVMVALRRVDLVDALGRIAIGAAQ